MKKTKRLVWGTATGGAAGWFAWRSLAVEPYAFEQTHNEWFLSRLPPALDGLTLCHLSDLHLRKRGRRDEKVADLLDGKAADLVVITGDFVDSVEGMVRAAELCRCVRSRLGHFGVWGDHEHLPEHGFDLRAFRRWLESHGIQILQNEHRILSVRGAEMALIGTDDLRTGHADLARACQGLGADLFRILLVHNPDMIVQAADYHIDLQLSGHTHGGQVRIPGFGAPFTMSRFRGRMDFGRFDAARLAYATGRQGITTRLYVSRGVGTSLLPIRFHCRPEIAWHTLRALPAGEPTNPVS